MLVGDWFQFRTPEQIKPLCVIVVMKEPSAEVVFEQHWSSKLQRHELHQTLLGYIQSYSQHHLLVASNKLSWELFLVVLAFPVRDLRLVRLMLFLFPFQHHSEGCESSAASDQLPSPQHALSQRQATGQRQHKPAPFILILHSFFPLTVLFCLFEFPLPSFLTSPQLCFQSH